MGTEKKPPCAALNTVCDILDASMLGFSAAEEDTFQENAERRAKLLVKLKNASPAAASKRPQLLTPERLDLSGIDHSALESVQSPCSHDGGSPRGETEEQRDIRRWYTAVARAREASVSPGLSESRSPVNSPPTILTNFVSEDRTDLGRFNADELDESHSVDSDESELVEIRAYTREDGHVSPRVSRDIIEALSPQSSPTVFDSTDSVDGIGKTSKWPHETEQEHMSGLLGTPSQSPAGIRGFCSSGGRWNPATSMGSPSLHMPRDSPSQSVAERCRQALQRSERSLSSRSAATPLKDSPSRQFHSPFRQTAHRSTSPFGNLQREVEEANRAWREHQNTARVAWRSEGPDLAADELLMTAVVELEWYQSTMCRLVGRGWEREALWRALTTWIMFNCRSDRTRIRVMQMERDTKVSAFN